MTESVVMKNLRVSDKADMSLLAECHQIWCIIILEAESKEYCSLSVVGMSTRAPHLLF